MIARVELTESCCPATGKPSVRTASSGGSSSIQARGRNSGRASISRASTGSAFRRNSLASGSAIAARLRDGASTLILLAAARVLHRRDAPLPVLLPGGLPAIYER